MGYDFSNVAQIVRDVAAEAIGSEALSNIDSSSMVAMGDLLAGTQYTEFFLNTLYQRIGKTVISFRPYKNKLRDLIVDDFRWGAILQKIKTAMPKAEEDQMYSLTDGQSVDQYKINKLQTKQKMFVSETPYQFHITTPLYLLEEAFVSEEKMAAFIASRMGETENALEVAMENLGRMCIYNYMANTTNVIHLLTEYNALMTTPVTADKALTDSGFLRYAVRRIKGIMSMLTEMLTIYNEEDYERHTPIDLQRVKIIADFQYAMETTVDYAAFNDNYVKLSGYEVMNFWQNPNTPYSIDVTPNTNNGPGEETKINNIVGIIYDRDALGIYKIFNKVLTSPINAAGGYYNTYWHDKQLWFNDLSENFIMFTLD